MKPKSESGLPPDWRDKLSLSDKLLLSCFYIKLARHRAQKAKTMWAAITQEQKRFWEEYERKQVKVKILRSIVLSNKLGLIRPEDL